MSGREHILSADCWCQPEVVKVCGCPPDGSYCGAEDCRHTPPTRVRTKSSEAFTWEHFKALSVRDTFEIVRAARKVVVRWEYGSRVQTDTSAQSVAYAIEDLTERFPSADPVPLPAEDGDAT